MTTSSAGYRGHRAGPLPAGTAWARYPYAHAGVSAADALQSLDLVLLQQASASEIAAVLIEPVLGEGGYVVPPAGFMPALRAWCVRRRRRCACEVRPDGAARAPRARLGRGTVFGGARSNCRDARSGARARVRFGVASDAARAGRTRCDTHDVLLICDEVQSGYGRTGKMWASDWEGGVRPDILVTAKGIASGYQVRRSSSRVGIIVGGRAPRVGRPDL